MLSRNASEEPSGKLIVLQFAVGLGAMIGGAHLFVEQAIELAGRIGVEPLVLSLILAPLATELPEKINSFFWVREGKDSLALGNITGAMVFQSTIPVAFGLALTDWDLDRFAIVSALLGLAGGTLAYFTLRNRGRFDLFPVIGWATLFGGFLAYVLASG
jgi:cation:H+ antiporter